MASRTPPAPAVLGRGVRRTLQGEERQGVRDVGVRNRDASAQGVGRAQL